MNKMIRPILFAIASSLFGLCVGFVHWSGGTGLFTVYLRAFYLKTDGFYWMAIFGLIGLLIGLATMRR